MPLPTRHGSFMPTYIKTNVLYSQAHRFLHVTCDRLHDFVEEIVHLMTGMLLEGYSRPKLMSTLRTFLAKQITPYNKPWHSVYNTIDRILHRTAPRT